MNRTPPQDRAPLLVVGIDVSALSLEVAIEGESEVLRFPNTKPGRRSLRDRLASTKRPVRVVLEATGAYHENVVTTLAAHRKIEVMVINPRRAKAFAAAQELRAKTDKVDARSLQAFAKAMPFTPWADPGPEAHALRQLSRYRGQLVRERTAEMNQLAAHTVSDRAVVLVTTMRERRLQQLNQDIAAVEAEILRVANQGSQTANHLQALASIPGIGPTTAAKLLAEFMFLDKSMDSKQVTAYAGLDPRVRQSGTSVNARPSISKRGNGRIREALYMGAVAASRTKTVIGAYYTRVAGRAPAPQVAVVATMRKLLTIAWAVYRTEKPWDPRQAAPRPPE